MKERLSLDTVLTKRPDLDYSAFEGVIENFEDGTVPMYHTGNFKEFFCPNDLYGKRAAFPEFAKEVDRVIEKYNVDNSSYTTRANMQKPEVLRNVFKVYNAFLEETDYSSEQLFFSPER